MQNPSQNIIFSPNLEYPVKYKLKGKAVLIEFDDKEVLRDSTTYSISFGSAIEDISEKNTSNNFKFVFSTGNYIDSIELKGKVVDAFSGEPLDKILVTLYDDLSDTAFTKRNHCISVSQIKMENLVFQISNPIPIIFIPYQIKT